MCASSGFGTTRVLSLVPRLGGRLVASARLGEPLVALATAIWTGVTRAPTTRFLARSGVVGALVLLLALSPAGPPAQAATTCLAQGASNYVFDGTAQQTTTYADYANLDTQQAALCTTGNSASASAAWVMIAGGGSGNGYAQVGILTQRGVPQMNYFVQWARDYPTPAGTPFYSSFEGVASGSHNYQVLYDFNQGALQLWTDSTMYTQTTFDPAVSWTAPWVNEWEGETHDPGDDMPGTASSPEHFSYLQYKACRGCGFQTPSGLQLSCVCSRYSYAWDTQNYSFHIWTSG